MKTILLFIVTIFYLPVPVISSAPGWLWAKSAHSSGPSSQGYNIVTDPAGNIYANGVISGTGTFGSINVPGTGGDDIFLAKYDPNGNVLWARSAGGNGTEVPGKMAVDGNGNIYIIGYFYSSIMIAGLDTLVNDSAGLSDIFIVKYDSSGAVIWAKREGGKSGDFGSGIAVDNVGNVYITGSFNGDAVFGNDTLHAHGAYPDLFTVKCNSSGAVVWARGGEDVSTDVGVDIAVDASQNVYVTGYFHLAFFFGNDFVNYQGSYDTFLLKYDAGGNPVWGRCVAGGSGIDQVTDMVIGPTGNLYLTGFFDSPTIALDTLTFYNHAAPFYDIYILGYDSSGNSLWARIAGGTSEDVANGITLDPQGNVAITGIFESSFIQFGFDTLFNAGVFNIFATRYNAYGSVLWVKQAGGTAQDIGWGIASDNSGNFYVTGSYGSHSCYFDTNVLTTSGSETIFVARLGSSITGMDYITDLPAINVYPNPSQGEIHILVPSCARLIQISNSIGQILKTIIPDGHTEITADLKENGMYYIIITDDKNSFSKKIIINR